jgi:hypothetical protein
MKCVFPFALQILSETFRTVRRNEPVMIKSGFFVNILNVLHILMTNTE